MSNTKYWLCCGSTDSYHGPERVGQCTEARAGNPDRCRFGTKEDHKEYLNADTAKDKSINAELVKALEGFLEMYCQGVNCGDWGNWDPEEDDEVIGARKALSTARGDSHDT